jgi:hypothetical protein
MILVRIEIRLTKATKKEVRNWKIGKKTMGEED